MEGENRSFHSGVITTLKDSLESKGNRCWRSSFWLFCDLLNYFPRMQFSHQKSSWIRDPSVLQLQHLKPQWLVTIPWVHLSSPRVSPGKFTQYSCAKINSQACFQKYLFSVLWPHGHPNILWQSCHFSDHHPCHTIFPTVCHTLCYSFSFYLLLHLTTSADSGTVTTLPLLKATRSQLVQPFQNQLAEIWGSLDCFHLLCFVLYAFSQCTVNLWDQTLPQKDTMVTMLQTTSLWSLQEQWGQISIPPVCSKRPGGDSWSLLVACSDLAEQAHLILQLNIILKLTLN